MLRKLFIVLTFIGLVAYGLEDLTHAVAGKAVKAHHAALQAI